jgi:hypothetical protein
MAQRMLEDDSAQPSRQAHFDMVKDVAGMVYLAGSDTIVVAVLSFFLAMLVYPDVQAKAQAEIDRVVGRDRLPELGDEEELPYVQGIVNECLRWLPVGPMGKLFLRHSDSCLRIFKASRIRPARTMSTRDTSYQKARSSWARSGALSAPYVFALELMWAQANPA